MRYSWLLLFMVISGALSAQYFQTGQDPASIKWRQINTDNFQLIYPRYYEAQAQKLARKLEMVYDYGSYSLDYRPRKISVILHTQTVKSNGLVALAPRRAEFYTTPHQGIYPQDWLEQLVLHEFRHVVQIGKVQSNMPELIKAILGEQGTALVFGAYLPWWFIEGDAVAIETALSQYGRGRLPSFLMEHRAQVVEKGVFSYDKAYLDSYRDFVPDHYKLGYYLVGNARERYGARLWERALTRTGQKPLSLNPVNRSLKEQTGYNKVRLYHAVFDSLQRVWNRADQEFNPLPSSVVTPAEPPYTNYIYNHWLSDSSFISYRESFKSIPAFVKIDPKGGKKKLFSPGRIFRESVSYRDEWIVWSEQIPDPRWEHSGKSLLRLYNTETGKKQKIDPEYICFSPALSPGKERMAVVETDFSNHYYISVYQVSTGQLLDRFQAPGNPYYFSPEWLSDDEIAFIILGTEGKRIAKVDITTKKMTLLLDTEMGDVKHLRVSGNTLYFISSYPGKNTLFRLDLQDKRVEQVYEGRFGVESPAVSPDGNEGLLSDYTANGFRLIRVSANSGTAIPLDEVKQGSYPLADSLSRQEQGIPAFTKVDTTDLPSTRYSKAGHLFNFHSWAPVSVDAGAYEFSPGVSIMSQNKLGTAETVLGYEWNIAEKAGRYYGKFTYKGWYPVIDLEISSGKRALIQREDTISRRYTWQENEGRVNLRLPLNFSRGAYNRYLQPEVQYNISSINRHSSTPEQFPDGQFQTMTGRLYFHQLLRQSKLDMYPDFGIVLDGAYRYSLPGTLDPGNIGAVESVLYLPGLLKNHGIKLYGGAQKYKDQGVPAFSDIIKSARGWGRRNTTDLYTATADYKLPLLYPDMNIGGLLYLTRLKAAFFGDYSYLKGIIYDNGKRTGRFETDISSFGVELTGDVHFLRFYAPVDIGIRTSYLPKMRDVYFHFLLSVNFTAL